MGIINSLMRPILGSIFSNVLGGMGGMGSLLQGTASMAQFNPLSTIRSFTGMGSMGRHSGGGMSMQPAPQPQQGQLPPLTPIPESQPIKEELLPISNSVFPSKNTQSTQSLLPLTNAVFPTIGHNITSGFGVRQAPTAGASTYHQGIDIAGKVGNPLYAALSGVIQQVGNNKGMGNFLKMLADNGDTFTYGHANAFGVKPGQRVNAGDILGQLGNSGVSTGPHLHFMSSKNGAYFNPMDLFKKRLGQ